MYQIVILPAAKKDIAGAAQWYNNKQSGLGKRFVSQIRLKIRFIQSDPKASTIKYSTIRTSVLQVFPFMIYYTIDKDYDLIVILAVLHTSRDPETWQLRNP